MPFTSTAWKAQPVCDCFKAGTILLPVKSVGVMGMNDIRIYGGTEGGNFGGWNDHDWGAFTLWFLAAYIQWNYQ